MSYSLRLTKRAQVLIIVLIAFFVAGVAGFSVWYVNNQDNQVAPEDSAAGKCCNSFKCANGQEYGWDDNYGGSDCGDRKDVCGPDGAVSSGNECESVGDGGDDGCGGNNQKCCDNDNSPGSSPYAHGCNPGLSCLEGGVQAPADKQGTCKESVQGGSCDSCVGSCGSTGCSTSCNGIDAQTGCGIWTSHYACDGRSNSGCNSANGTSISAAPDYTNSANWCKTYQYDSSAPNGAYSVVYVGDGGEVCTTRGGQPNTCNPDDLDWDCTPIQGYLDRADCTKISGWACDPTDYNKPVEIHIYDGTKYITKTTANLQRTDVAEKCGGTTAHGFDIAMPAALLDGNEHDIFTYVIALDGSGNNPRIQPAPKSFDSATCNTPPTCNAITVSTDKVENGETVTLTTSTSDTNGASDIKKVELFWSKVLADAKYCGTQWTKIGAATNSGNNSWSLNWKVAGIPETGGIVIAGNVHDKAGAWCTGNPSGKCSTAAQSCKKCSLVVGIDTPMCNNLTVSGDAVQNGNTVNISLAVTDERNVSSIPLYWVVANEALNYCTAADHVAIGNATKGTGGNWSYTWNVSGIPDSGSIEIFADVKGASTTFCTGNPSGTCGASTISCPTCNQSVTVNIPQCGGSCTSDEQCDGSLSCVSGMCRNPICTSEEDCICNIPVTGLFDNTLAKVGAGLLLVSFSLGYMMFDGFDRFVIKTYSDAQEAVSEETRHKRKRKDFEDRWDD